MGSGSKPHDYCDRNCRGICHSKRDDLNSNKSRDRASSILDASNWSRPWAMRTFQLLSARGVSARERNLPLRGVQRVSDANADRRAYTRFADECFRREAELAAGDTLSNVMRMVCERVLYD